MRIFWFSIALTAALGMSCSPGVVCGPQNCAGCCGSTGECVPGNVVTQCGTAGGVCGACAANQVCQLGGCVTIGQGGKCDSSNCQGCCQGTACLQPSSQTPAACGLGGTVCAGCGSGQTCQSGTCAQGAVDSGTGDGGNSDGGGSDAGGSDGGGGCGPANCAGCCVGNICIPLVDENSVACGSGGSSCGSCGKAACVQGVCAGSDGGPQDAGTCGPGNCAGCCIGKQCVPVSQENASFCGDNGQACASCGAQTCDQGVCVPPADAGSCGPGNCTGCCVGNQCITLSQQTNNECGFNGQTCTGCTGGTTCQSGFCQGSDAGTCQLFSCAGCCLGNTCLDPLLENNFFCGFLGEACMACPSGTTCDVLGQCTAPPDAGTCGTGNCAGCCAGNTCIDVANETDTQCGNGGNACQSCGTGTTCSATGVCAVPLGAPCGSNLDCASMGIGAICKQTTSYGNASYPGGMCTFDCSATQCPSGSACSQDYLAYGEAEYLCLPTCQLPGSCGRAGYDCHPSEVFFLPGTCWLSPLPFAPPAPAGEIGKACSADSQCGPPPYDGNCNTGSGWVNGYCSAGCDAGGNAHCGGGAECLDFGNVFFPDLRCRSTCPGPLTGRSTCRAGYVCEWQSNGTDGGVASVGHCEPDCNNAGGPGCQAPYGCTGQGYCCDDGGNCQ